MVLTGGGDKEPIGFDPPTPVTETFKSNFSKIAAAAILIMMKKNFAFFSFKWQLLFCLRIIRIEANVPS